MKYIHLGRSGALVSRICLGTMNFGGITPESESHRIMDKALELGINYFDTANVYGRELGDGLTEQIIGRWFSQGENRRNSVLLATKVHCPMGSTVNERGSSAYHIRRSVEDSLKRLQTDHIDLLVLHHLDRGVISKAEAMSKGIDEPEVSWPNHLNRITPFEEIWEAAASLINQGKISYIGFSNYPAWAIVRGCERAFNKNMFGPVSVQNIYNLNLRFDEMEVIPACREYGLGYTPWSPLAGGLLAGALEKYNTGRRANLEKIITNKRSELEKWEKLCSDIGLSPARTALAWLLHTPIVTAPIIGPRTVEQLIDNTASVDAQLDNEILEKIDTIWKAVGEATESYAW